MFNLSLSLQLNISSGRDRNRSMDEWLKEQIEAARKRGEQKERKLARREADAQTIERDKDKFWQALYNSLQLAVDEFNNAGVSDEPVSFDVINAVVQVRTSGYPSVELQLRFRDKKNDVHFTLIRRSSSMLQSKSDGTLDFDVSDDGHIMVRNNVTLLDVLQATAYLLSMVFPAVHSGRD